MAVAAPQLQEWLRAPIEWLNENWSEDSSFEDMKPSLLEQLGISEESDHALVGHLFAHLDALTDEAARRAFLANPTGVDTVVADWAAVQPAEVHEEHPEYTDEHANGGYTGHGEHADNGEAATDYTRFDWVPADLWPRLSALYGEDWGAGLGDGLDSRWGADWEGHGADDKAGWLSALVTELEGGAPEVVHEEPADEPAQEPLTADGTDGTEGTENLEEPAPDLTSIESAQELIEAGVTPDEVAAVGELVEEVHTSALEDVRQNAAELAAELNMTEAEVLEVMASIPQEDFADALAAEMSTAG